MISTMEVTFVDIPSYMLLSILSYSDQDTIESCSLTCQKLFRLSIKTFQGRITYFIKNILTKRPRRRFGQFWVFLVRIFHGAFKPQKCQKMSHLLHKNLSLIDMVSPFRSEELYRKDP